MLSLYPHLCAALLCRFVRCARAWDLSQLKQQLGNFLQLHRPLEGCREHQLLAGCMKAFDADDIEAYTDVVFQANKVKPLVSPGGSLTVYACAGTCHHCITYLQVLCCCMNVSSICLVARMCCAG